MDATDADLVVFLDDDFLPAAEFIETAELLFLGNMMSYGRPEALSPTAFWAGIRLSAGVRSAQALYRPEERRNHRGL